MSAPKTSLTLFPESQSGPLRSGSADADSRPRPGRRRWLPGAACILLSVALHTLGIWVADFRPVHHMPQDSLVVLDIAAPRMKPASLPASPALPAPDKTPMEPAPPSVAARPQTAPPPRAVETRSPEAVVSKREQPASGAEARRSPSPQRKSRAPVRKTARSETPIGQVASRPGVTVLANESGQDALKHGSEARFMHGVATEEFVEDNYVGEYAMGKLGRVWIEDDRARSGHLILHAEHMDFTRPLFRFNRFIYVYGENPDSPEPILGSVTFFSDGYHIHQFLWQHNATYAYYPRRD